MGRIVFGFFVGWMAATWYYQNNRDFNAAFGWIGETVGSAANTGASMIENGSANGGSDGSTNGHAAGRRRARRA